MATVAGQFTIDAWILADRWRHHRVRDHFGPENATYVVCDTPIGRFPPGTPVSVIIADMFDRLSRLENANRRWSSFVVDAFIAESGTYGFGLFRVDAVTKKEMTGSFKADAVLKRGSSFVIDAQIVGCFTIQALIV